jgi:hypothetical protein
LIQSTFGLVSAVRPQANAAIICAEQRAFDRAMGKHEKTLQQVLLGRSDANIAFADLRNLLLALGFDERVRGDHHIFTRSGVEEIINLQPISAKAKPYQVRQVRNAVLRYKMEL